MSLLCIPVRNPKTFQPNLAGLMLIVSLCFNSVYQRYLDRRNLRPGDLAQTSLAQPSFIQLRNSFQLRLHIFFLFCSYPIKLGMKATASFCPKKQIMLSWQTILLESFKNICALVQLETPKQKQTNKKPLKHLTGQRKKKKVKCTLTFSDVPFGSQEETTWSLNTSLFMYVVFSTYVP